MLSMMALSGLINDSLSDHEPRLVRPRAGEIFSEEKELLPPIFSEETLAEIHLGAGFDDAKDNDKGFVVCFELRMLLWSDNGA